MDPTATPSYVPPAPTPGRSIFQWFIEARDRTLRSMSPGKRWLYRHSRSVYMPHQGKRECARRVRQLEVKS